MTEELRITHFETNLEKKFKPQQFWGNECFCREPLLDDELKCKLCNGIRKTPFITKKKRKNDK